MGNPCWNRDHITLGQVMYFATPNVRSALLIWSCHLASDYRTPSDECCFPVNHVECVGFFVVKFNLARARAREDFEQKAGLRDQRSALGGLCMAYLRHCPCYSRSSSDHRYD
jgi:hypothetical protein